MDRRIVIALSVLLCSLASTSQASFMQTSIQGGNPFQAALSGLAMPGQERELCISPCYSQDLGQYIAQLISSVQYSAPPSLPNLFTKPATVSHPKHVRVPNLNPGHLSSKLTGPEVPTTNEKELPFIQTRLLSKASSTNKVPAPATLALFGLGLAGLGCSRRKKA